jgi:hypothetical protein
MWHRPACARDVQNMFSHVIASSAGVRGIVVTTLFARNISGPKEPFRGLRPDCEAVGLWNCGTVGLWDRGTVGLWEASPTPIRPDKVGSVSDADSA